MTEVQKSAKKSSADQASATEDFSELIEQTLDRQPDEEVRCVRVFDDRYRCNWWVRGKAVHWLLPTTGSIRKSAFLRAIKDADTLLIEDLSNPR